MESPCSSDFRPLLCIIVLHLHACCDYIWMHHAGTFGAGLMIDLIGTFSHASLVVAMTGILYDIVLRHS